MKQEVYRTANYAEVGSERGATVIPTERSIEEDLENTHTSPGHFLESIESLPDQVKCWKAPLPRESLQQINAPNSIDVLYDISICIQYG